MKYNLLLLLLLSVLPLVAPAQIILGQPSLDEQKTQIWCATIKFVYDDTGTPALKQTVQCGSSLKALENSIKADKQGVYSLLYQPLEGRGAMYKGLSSDKARLQKLRDEIINRLKASPSRKGSPARLRAVDALAATLTTYVNSGTPPGDVDRAPEAADTLTDEAPVATLVDPADNPNYAVPAPAGNRDGVLSSLFAPIAFILALLALVLFWLLRGTLKTVAKRVDQHRKELEWVRAGTAGSAPAPAGAFTPEQHAEVEKLVRQRVAAELQRLLEMEQASPADEMLAPAAPTAAAPETPAAVPAVEAPVAYSPPAATHLETPPAAPRDEFNSLVVPVPKSYVAAARHYYAKAPTDGAFREQDFRDEPEPDSLYEITLGSGASAVATFQVNSDPTVYASVFEGDEHLLRAACTYPQPDAPVSYIVNDAPGTLRWNGDAWQVEQPAQVHFE